MTSNPNHVYSVSYCKYKEEIYILASGNGFFVEVFRLKDFMKNVFTSKLFFESLANIILKFFLTSRPNKIGEVSRIWNARIATQDLRRFDVLVQVWNIFLKILLLLFLFQFLLIKQNKLCSFFKIFTHSFYLKIFFEYKIIQNSILIKPFLYFS